MFIYGLHDPRDGALRYVGACADLERRLHWHLVYKKRQIYQAWIAELVAIGLKPEIREIETVDESQWRERERYWIAQYRSEGVGILNIKPGGEGGPTLLGKKLSPEHCRSLSQALMGHAVTQESIDKTNATKRLRGVIDKEAKPVPCPECGRDVLRLMKGVCQKCYDKARRLPFLRGRAHLRRTHCKNGHEMTGDNVVIGADGGRRCRSCQREYDLQYKKAKYWEGRTRKRRSPTHPRTLKRAEINARREGA